MPVTDARASGSELHWHIGAPDRPAVLVFQFADHPKPPTGMIWVRGTCRGRVADSGERELHYEFHVLVTGCEVVSPPAMPKP